MFWRQINIFIIIIIISCSFNCSVRLFCFILSRNEANYALGYFERFLGKLCQE